MGIWCVCNICKDTVDFDKIRDHTEHLVCNKCLDRVPDYVPESQQHAWLQRNKNNENNKKRW